MWKWKEIDGRKGIEEGMRGRAGGDAQHVVKDLRDLKRSGGKVVVEVVYVSEHCYCRRNKRAPNWSSEHWVVGEEQAWLEEDLSRPAIYVLGDRFGNWIAFHVPTGEYRAGVAEALLAGVANGPRGCYRLGNVVAKKDGCPR